MKPPLFEYVAASSVEEAVSLLSTGSDGAKLIAGGQSLMPMLNFRLLEPDILIDIARIPALNRIEETEDGLVIGSTTPHQVVADSELVARHFPIIIEAMRHVAHLAIRNRGTVGGSMCHADPAAEWPMLALLLDAKLDAQSEAGLRRIEARDFFQDALTTCLGDEEILVSVEFPRLPEQTGWGFEEVARRHGDFALAAAAATLAVQGNEITAARIAVMGVDATPLRLEVVEDLFVGQTINNDLLDGAATLVRNAINPMDDLHASTDYRRHLAGVLVKRAIGAAWARATVGAS